MVVVALMACTLPPATPAPGDLAALRSRVDRSYADSESVLRLSAGMWSVGDRDGSQRLLEEALSAEPGAVEYVAALAAIDESNRDYMAAREGYLDFLGTAGRSRLSTVLAERPSLLRGVTADAIAEQLVDGDRILDHGTDPVVVMALPRIQPLQGNPSSEEFAILATELLVRDLRSRRHVVIDWELSEAVRQRLVTTTDEASVPEAMARHLSARVVVTGSLLSAADDSVSMEVQVHWIDDASGRVLADTLEVSLAPYVPDRARLSTRITEMAAGAEEGALSLTELDVSDFVPQTILSRFGEGLLLVASGDHAGARVVLGDAAERAPDFAPLRERLDHLNSMMAVEGSETMPFADDILTFARSAVRTRSAIQATGTSWATHGAFERGGVGEVLGLDRIGAQVFLDLLITIGGPS